MIKEYIVHKELSVLEMNKLVKNTNKNEWMEHTPESALKFKTLGSAKRSARKFWKQDDNDYVIVYEIIKVESVYVNVLKV